MSKLEEFLDLEDVADIKKSISVNIGGKLFDLVIRPITESEHHEFQKRSNVFNKNKVTFDSGKYSSLVLEACIVEPDFKNSDFLKKAGCVSAGEFLDKKFPAGVISDITHEITKLSGFDSYDVEIENAKN